MKMSEHGATWRNYDLDDHEDLQGGGWDLREQCLGTTAERIILLCRYFTLLYILYVNATALYTDTIATPKWVQKRALKRVPNRSFF